MSGVISPKPHLRPRAVILAILLLAAALRWMEPGLVEFKYDEANIARMALGVAGRGELPLLTGGTSLGIQRPALDVYLMAAGLVLGGGRIEAATWMLSALGVAAVALAYLLGRRVAGPNAGALAALYMAANPWLVAYDRKLWAHIQTLFSVLLLLLAWEVVVRGRRRGAFWFPVVAALQGLTHVLAFLQAASWLAAVLVAPRRWLRRETALGIAAGAALYAPYVVALAGWWAARSGAAGPAGEGSVTRLAARVREMLYLFGGFGVNGTLGLPVETSPWWQLGLPLSWAVLLLIALGVFVLALGVTGRTRQGDGARLLLAWAVGPLALLLAAPLRVFPQYWTVLLPLPALYFALGVGAVSGAVSRVVGRLRSARHPVGSPRTGVSAASPVPHASRIPGVLVTGLVAVVAGLTWAGSHLVMLHQVGRGAGGRGFGVPLARWQETLDITRDWASRLGTEEVRVAVNGVDPGYDSEPAVVALLLGGPPWARFVAPQSPAALLLAQDRPSLYLWAIEDGGTEALLEQAGEVTWQGSLADGHPPARLYRLPPAREAALGGAVTWLEQPRVFDAGLALTGYAFPAGAQANRELTATLVWRVLDPPPEVRQRDLTAFNHILDAGGERVAQVDGLALLSRDWWPGDVLFQRYTVVLPGPGDYTWRVGLYSRLDGARAALVTGGDSVDLGPLRIQ